MGVASPGERTGASAEELGPTSRYRGASRRLTWGSAPVSGLSLPPLPPAQRPRAQEALQILRPTHVDKGPRHFQSSLRPQSFPTHEESVTGTVRAPRGWMDAQSWRDSPRWPGGTVRCRYRAEDTAGKSPSRYVPSSNPPKVSNQVPAQASTLLEARCPPRVTLYTTSRF